MATTMYCYMVSYDLAKPDQSNYEDLAEDLGSMGFRRSQNSLWLKRSSVEIDVAALRNRLRKNYILSASSRLFVSRICCDDNSSFNSDGVRQGKISFKRGHVPDSIKYFYYDDD